MLPALEMSTRLRGAPSSGVAQVGHSGGSVSEDAGGSSHVFHSSAEKVWNVGELPFCDIIAVPQLVQEHSHAGFHYHTAGVD
jgi:hypothetical protein